MNTRYSAWTRRVLPVLLASGCSQPSLDLSFEPPVGVSVAQVTLRYLEPPAAEPFGCDALAFGEIDARRLELSLRQTVTVAAGAASAGLEHLSREGRKVFWATGLAPGGGSVAEGCVEVGAVTAPTRLTLAGEPTPRVTLRSNELSDGGSVTLGVEGADGAVARWRLAAAGDAGSSGEVAASGGRVVVRAAAPHFGPFAVRVAVKWSPEGPLEVAGLSLPAPRVETRFGDLVQAVGVRDSVAVALIDGGLRVETFSWDGGRVAAISSVRHVIPGRLVSTGDGYEMVKAPGLREAHRTWPSGRRCSGGPLITETFEDGGRITIDLNRTPVSHPIDGAAGAIVATGCIDTTDGGVVPAYVLRPDMVARVWVFDAAAGVSKAWPGVSFGFGFLPPNRAGVRHLVASRASTDGFALTRNHLDLSASSMDFVTDEEVNTGERYPGSIAAGDFDRDGEQDVVMVMIDSQLEPSLWLWSGARPPWRQPLIAGLPLSPGCAGIATVFTVDVGSDGEDDFAVVRACAGSVQLDTYDFGPP